MDPEVAGGWQVVRSVAGAPARSSELEGWEQALGHFRAAVPVSTRDIRVEGGRRMTPTTMGSRIGVAAAGVLLLGFGGVGAVALTGSLPDSRPSGVPTAAPTTGGLAAPAGVIAPSGGGTVTAGPTPDDSDDSEDGDGAGRPEPGAVPTTAVGPDATGPAARGLCTAWSHAKPSKRTASHSVAFRNLVAAAGGEGRVDAYCAALPHPSAGKPDKPSSHPTGRPSGNPGKGGKAPSGKPTQAPGAPTTAPARPTTAPSRPATAPSLPTTPTGKPSSVPSVPSAPFAPSGAGTRGQAPAATATAG